MNDGYFECLEDIWETDEEVPGEIGDEAGTTLIVWACTKDAETLNWVVRPGTEPEKWPVMVLNDDADTWETCPVTATGFLAGLLAGQIDSFLSSELTPPRHSFEPDRPVITPLVRPFRLSGRLAEWSASEVLRGLTWKRRCVRAALGPKEGL